MENLPTRASLHFVLECRAMLKVHHVAESSSSSTTTAGLALILKQMLRKTGRLVKRPPYPSTLVVKNFGGTSIEECNRANCKVH